MALQSRPEDYFGGPLSGCSDSAQRYSGRTTFAIGVFCERGVWLRETAFLRHVRANRLGQVPAALLPATMLLLLVIVVLQYSV
jgi:hypothetical protein